MAKYGVPKYGDGTRYGTSTATSWTETGSVQWILQIDWDNDGSLDGTNEAAWLMDVDGMRGRQFYVRADGLGFERIQPGMYTLTMDNKDGRYDPRNASSPLYPNVKPGHKAKLSVKDLSSGTIYPRITGEIDDIQPIQGTDRVRLVIVDGLKKLKQAISTDQPGYGISADAAINKALDMAGWGGNRSIQSSDLELMMFDIDDRKASDVLHGLAEASLGTFFIARNGTAKYYDLGYNSMSSHSLDQSELLKEIRINQPWDEVRNDVKVKATKWVKTGNMTIWSLAAPQYIGPRETIIFTSNYDAAMDLATFRYSANAEADGSGTDRTVFVSWSRTVRQGSTKWWFTNYYSEGVYLTSLRIYGRKLVEIQTTFDDVDASSQADYGVRSFRLESEFLQDNTHADAYKTIILDHLKDDVLMPIIQIEQRPSLQFAPDLFDKIPLTAAKLGIDDTFRVGMITERWLDSTGQATRTMLYLQDVIYSSDSIGTDPPTLAIIPEDTTYGGGENSEPVPPEGTGTEEPLDDNCITDLEYPANGPFSVGFYGEFLSSMMKTWVIPYHCWLRQHDATNPTRYQIHADWQKRDGSGVLVDTMDDDFYDVYAIDAKGNRVATGIHDPVTGTGEVRTGYFAPPAPVEIFGIEIDFATWDRIYLSDPEVEPETVTSSIEIGSGRGNVLDAGSPEWEYIGAGVEATVEVSLEAKGTQVWTTVRFTPPSGVSYKDQFFAIYSTIQLTSTNGASIANLEWLDRKNSIDWIGITGTQENPSSGYYTLSAEFQHSMLDTPSYLPICIYFDETSGAYPWDPYRNIDATIFIQLYPRSTYRINISSFQLWNICPV